MTKKLNALQEMMLSSGMLVTELPPKRVIATFVGTAGELLARCKEVLGEKSIAVTCECHDMMLCDFCGEEKDVEDFYPLSGAVDQAVCVDCYEMMTD